MRFSLALFTTLALSASAAPTPKRARSLKTRQAGPVLADTTFNDITISGGVAGDAEAEALAVFSALPLDDLASVDPADIEFLGAVNDVANDAETDAFNTAIEAATGEEATALENGKIKNKVLKLMATKIELEAQAAQGEDTAAKLAEETTKLNNNIALDQAAAGQASTALNFDAAISGGGAAGGAAAAADTGDAAADEADAGDAVAVEDVAADEDAAADEADAGAAIDEDADAAAADEADESEADENEVEADEAEADEAEAEADEEEADEE